MARKLAMLAFLVCQAALAPRAEAASQALWNKCGGKDPDTMIAACTRILSGHESHKNKSVAFYNRGSAYIVKGNLAKALADFTQAIKENPKAAPAFNDRGWVYKQMGDSDHALADLAEAIRLASNFASPYINRCVLREQLADHVGALRDCDAAIRINPKNARVYAFRGNVLRTMGDTDRAIKDYDKALSLNSKEWLALYGRALARESAGDLAAAYDDAGRALALKPDDTGTQTLRDRLQAALDAHESPAGAAATSTRRVARRADRTRRPLEHLPRQRL